jgi:hypothetical protein
MAAGKRHNWLRIISGNRRPLMTCGSRQFMGATPPQKRQHWGPPIAITGAQQASGCQRTDFAIEKRRARIVGRIVG